MKKVNGAGLYSAVRVVRCQRGSRLTPRPSILGYELTLFSLQVVRRLFEEFLLVTFGHLLQFASMAFAGVAPLPLVSL
jgi:hypothetical protein